MVSGHRFLHLLTVDPLGMDGQVRLVSWQTDNFGLFLRQQKQTTNFRLRGEQIVNGFKENRLGIRFLFPFSF
jgi:hypothetical protein